MGTDVKDVFAPSSCGSTRTQNHRMRSQRRLAGLSECPLGVLAGKSKAQREEEACSEYQGSTPAGPAKTEWDARFLSTSYAALLPNYDR